MANITPSDYFLQALEAQRAINTHINEIEPTTPIFLYEIDLNEIRPATITYPNSEGPIRDGVLRIHNDFNIFNINRGIIKWKGNYYFPFPIYGEQFDITSNGTIPSPKVKFSSQFLDDEYNSFYKYIRMQINELKDIVGSKVTRRKTFVRYLSPDNFEGNVNPFNDFTDAPWASRDGDVLTVRSIIRVPTNFSKWLIYYPKPNYGDKLKIFSCLRTDDRSRILSNQYQIQNYARESNDLFSLYVNDIINVSSDVTETFTTDIFAISGNNTNYTKIIPEQDKEFTEINSSNKLKIFCGTSGDNFTGIYSFATPNFPITFSQPADSLISFISLKSNAEAYGQKFSYQISNQTQNSLQANFSDIVSGNIDFNYLTIPSGAYTGINPYSNDKTNLVALKIVNDFGTGTSGTYNIEFPLTFNNVPKILFNAQATSGFIFGHTITNISNTGCIFNVTNTGSGNYSLGLQSGFLLATDYSFEDFAPTGSTQIFTASNNLAREYLDQINSKQFNAYEVELTPDIFYVDRKVQEDSVNVVYELASLLDIEGIKLPGRILLSKNCPFTYRGEGCLYERSDRLTRIHSGIYGEVYGIATFESGAALTTDLAIDASQKCIGLQNAPPVSDANDITFSGEISSPNWEDKGAWEQGKEYLSGNFVHIEKNYIKYYFVCYTDHTANAITAPPNVNYWKSDTCSKTLEGCRLRWKDNPTVSQSLQISGIYLFSGYSSGYRNFVVTSDALVTSSIRAPRDANGNQLLGILPFGGFPSVEGKYQSQQGPQSQ